MDTDNLTNNTRRHTAPVRRGGPELVTTPTIDNWDFPVEEHRCKLTRIEQEFIAAAFPAAAFETTNDLRSHHTDAAGYYDPNENNWGFPPENEVIMVFQAPMYTALMKRGFRTTRPMKGYKMSSTSIERGEGVEFGLSATREDILSLVEKYPNHVGGYIKFFASNPKPSLRTLALRKERPDPDTYESGDFTIVENPKINLVKGWRVNSFHSGVCFGAGTSVGQVSAILDHIESELSNHGWVFVGYHTAVVNLR